MNSDMKNYLPHSLRDVKEFIVLCDVNNPDKDEIYSEMDVNTDDFYIETASDKGISRWESIMGIIPPSNATMDERLFELMIRVNNRVPYSEKRIKGILDNVLGAGNYDFTMNVPNLSLEVLLHLGSKYKLAIIDKLMDAIVPAHISMTISLKYNSHGTLHSYTHETLGNYTYKGVKDEVITE